MTFALADTPAAAPRADEAFAPIALAAPRHYQERALAIFEDAALLLSAILPQARVEHVGASAIPGAYSKGDVALRVAVPRDGLREALGVLGEAGFTLRAASASSALVLDAPESDVPLAAHLVDEDAADPLVAFRDALRGDATLLARYNAVRIEAAANGAASYGAAKEAFIHGVLSASA